MITDTDMRKRLNFVETSDEFVLLEDGSQGEAIVLSIQLVPKASGIYWIAGTTLLKAGREIDSVFRVDTDAGGSLVSVFWKIADRWYQHDDPDAWENLELAKNDVFPFDWSLAAPLEEDIFHS